MLLLRHYHSGTAASLPEKAQKPETVPGRLLGGLGRRVAPEGPPVALAQRPPSASNAAGPRPFAPSPPRRPSR